MITGVAQVNVYGSGGRLNVDLKTREQRSLDADRVIEELRPKFARIPGVRVFLSNPPAIRIGGMMSRSQYQYTLQDPDTDELYSAAPRFEAALRTVEGLEDVTSDLQIRNPQITVDLDRDQIAALGLTADQVELALTSAYGSRQVSQVFAPDDQYQVILQVDPRYQRDPADLSMLSVQTPAGKLVPLSTIVATRQTVGPLSVNHTGQLPSVTLSFSLRPEVSLGDAVARVQAVVTIETEGLRVTLRGADAPADGDTVRISLPAPKSGISSPAEIWSSTGLSTR